LTPEDFALILTNDFDSPVATYFTPMIAEQIRQQVMMYCGAVEEDFLHPITYDKPKVPENLDRVINEVSTTEMELDGISSQRIDISQEDHPLNGLNALASLSSYRDNDQMAIDSAKQEMKLDTEEKFQISVDSLEQGTKPELKIQDKDDLSYGDIRVIIKVSIGNID
jgi:hypothetical protein